MNNTTDDRMYLELKTILELLISSFWTQWHIGLDNIELQMPVFLEFLEEEGDEWFLRLHDHLTEMLSLENGTVKPFFVKYGVDFTISPPESPSSSLVG
jgi:hypothetical protein